MATLYITEFQNTGYTGLYGGSPTQVAAQPFNAQQTVATSASSASSAAFAQGTQLVRIHNDLTAPVAIRFGTGTVTALTTDCRLAINQTEYFTVPLNGGYKVAAIVTT